MRQSTAQSRHQLLPACGACGACKWCVSAGRRARLRLWLEQQRIRTEAIDADTTDHFRASGWRWAESDLQSLAQLATGGSCVDARPTPVGMAAASAHQQQLWLPSHGKDSKTSLPRPIGVMRRGRECGSQQPASHVTSSSPHVVHAAHANGAYQQAVATPVVA